MVRLPALLATVALASASLAFSAPVASAGGDSGAGTPDADTATSGAVAATFTHHDAGEGQWTNMKVSITRGGVPAYSAAPKVAGCAAPYCTPYGAVDSGGSLKVVDVTGDGEPEVIVNLYSGGAHCCEITQVLRWTGSAYTSLQRNFADFGYTLAPSTTGGATAFVTGDARFAYAFASFADSAFPFRVYRIDDGAWSEQTLSYEDGIKADAVKWKKAYNKRKNGRLALGILAAWVADEYQLGENEKADRFLDHERKAGRLKSMGPWPAGKAYIKLLKKDLKKWGYVFRRGATL
jgi:hypothetical protein